MALLKFTRAGRRSIHPPNKGGVRWLHEKATMVADKGGKKRLRDPVFFEHGQTYEVDDTVAATLARRHPDLFKIEEPPKPAPAKATPAPAPKKVEAKPEPEPEPETEQATESEEESES